MPVFFPVFETLFIGNFRYGLQLPLRILFYGQNGLNGYPRAEILVSGIERSHKATDVVNTVFDSWYLLCFWPHIRSQLLFYAIKHYLRVKSTNYSSTNLTVSEGFFQANAIRSNSIFYWPFLPLERIRVAPDHEYRRKQWASPWLLSDFDVVFSVSTRLLSSILMTVDLPGGSREPKCSEMGIISVTIG